jgi:hypothetical protein
MHGEATLYRARELPVGTFRSFRRDVETQMSSAQSAQFILSLVQLARRVLDSAAPVEELLLPQQA